MDGRDSLPAAGEDDGLSAVSDGLGKEAEVFFASWRFSDCVDVLKQLALKKEGDPKVLHNIAVAEYLRDGCSDPRKLLDVLNKIKIGFKHLEIESRLLLPKTWDDEWKRRIHVEGEDSCTPSDKRSDELARSSGEQVDSACKLGNNISGSNGSGTNLHQLSTTGAGSIAYGAEFDTSFITLNMAVVLYHLHEYAHSLSILEPLYQNLHPLDETTALHVCLRLLDIALDSHDAAKAADVIQYMDKCFGIGYMANPSDNGNTAQQKSLNQGTKATPISNSFVPDNSSSDSNASANVNENSLSGMLSDDALEYENLYSALDGGGQNLDRPSSNRAAPATGLKLKMYLYKVRLLLLTRNLKAAKREVKLAMNMARGRDSSAELLLKSQVEYTRGNYRKAVKLLMTSSNRTDPRMHSILYNNLGCIHYNQRGRHMSGLFFMKALKHSSSLRSEKPLKLYTFSQDKSLEITYNLGIQNLMCGKPFFAAKCFGKASLAFYNRALLWLRLAECCLLAMEKGLLGSNDKDITVHVAGSGTWRRLVVDDLISGNRYSNDEGSDECKLSLPFARYCLKNALLLLNKNNSSMPRDSKSPNVTPTANSNGDSKENKTTLSRCSTLQSSVAAYEDMRREENHMMRQAVLGDLAYIELGLENPLKSLSFSKSLIDLPECSKLYVFLGHFYAAEALVRLNRVKEAAGHLSAYLTEDYDIELPFSKGDKEKWWSIKRGVSDCEEVNNCLPTKTTKEESRSSLFLSPQESRGLVAVNLSSMFVMQGNLEKASQFASQALSLIPNHPKALLAALYIEILQGKTQEVIAKLKQFSRARYVSADVKLRSSSS